MKRLVCLTVVLAVASIVPSSVIAADMPCYGVLSAQVLATDSPTEITIVRAEISDTPRTGIGYIRVHGALTLLQALKNISDYTSAPTFYYLRRHRERLALDIAAIRSGQSSDVVLKTGDSIELSPIQFPLDD
jgi:hypothetical protein